MNLHAPFCAQRITLKLQQLTQTMHTLRHELAQVCQQLTPPASSAR
ncbi:hypothetical protein [Aquaspirillum sp. LM1]|nr:hypothetical protein [Aquaspirillum sp. LM1]